ncbi:hypothetical protein ES703_118825 [subsurface metagenome]
MRSPHSLYGGKGWPVDFSVATGDPEEVARAWLSSVPAECDGSVLWEPNGLKRTPACFDDHGEVRPLGEGPDLHIRISIPDGQFLLSLYSFEADWIQYRAYRIRVFAEGQADHSLVETRADNFFKGKYKRFIVLGPANLRIVIERGQSPNAQVSGIFLDKFGFPDMYLFDSTADSSVAPRDVAPLAPETAEHAAEDALARLLAAPENRSAQQGYVRHERAFFQAMENHAKTQPEAYCRELERRWTRAERRIDSALAALSRSPLRLELSLLRYYGARAHCDYESARREAQKIARSLLDQGLASQRPWLRSA